MHKIGCKIQSENMPLREKRRYRSPQDLHSARSNQVAFSLNEDLLKLNSCEKKLKIVPKSRLISTFPGKLTSP